jgi:hypothetical protein
MSSPNNTIDWGQGAVNNDIGWGQAAANNSIDWGYIHQFSYGHPETNLVGISAEYINNLYIQRVTAAGGYYEGEACAVAKIQAWL